MKILLNFLLIIISTLSLLAAEPFVNVPPLPTNLRNYITTNEKYFELLMGYYTRALILQAQLGIDNMVPPVSYTAIQNMEIREIRRYYNLARALYDSVKNKKDDPRLTNCQEKLEKVKIELEKYKIENDTLKLKFIEYETLRELIDIRDSIIKALNLKLFDCENDGNKVIIELMNRPIYFPILGANIKASQWFFDNPRINTYLAPSFDLELHLFNLANNVLGVKFATSYTYLTNIVEQPGREIPIKQTYKDDIWNFSVLFLVNLSKLINSSSLYWEIDLSAGYFKGFTKSPSPFLFQSDYKGYSLGVCTILGGFSRRVPIAVLAGASFYKYVDAIGYDGLLLGKPFLPSVFLGIKFNLLNTF